jgi:8-oxo-dGTP pyrophosphatase MutT (NUDIX family)
MKQCVCLLFSKHLKNNEKVYLAVSRKDDHNDFGLPGGKVEELEVPLIALYRECVEETSFIPWVPTLIHRGKNIAPNGSEWEILTYECLDIRESDIEVSQEEGIVAWLPIEKLFEGSFGKYNKDMIADLRRRGKDI